MNMMKMEQVRLNVTSARQHALTHVGDDHLTTQGPDGRPQACVYCVQIHIWLGEQADELANSITALQRRIDALLRATDDDIEDLGAQLGVLTVMEATL